MDNATVILLGLESESDEETFAVLTLLNKKRKKTKRNKYLRKKSTHGEFKLSKEIPENVPYFFPTIFPHISSFNFALK
jgi:hypothetical protein